MDVALSSTVSGILLSFQSVFSAPSFLNFVTLVTGAILCPTRHTLTALIRCGAPVDGAKHFSVYYRFLSQARWSLDQLSEQLVRLVLHLIPDDCVQAIVDDTLCHRGGPQIFGAAMHHDACASTYARAAGGSRMRLFSFGHCWVVLSLWVPLPWGRARGMALPVMFRLYRGKKRCPPADYRKRSELAAELIDRLARQIGPERTLMLSGDREYACQTIVRARRANVTVVGPMPMNAALYDTAPPYAGLGRPRKHGDRLPSPHQLATDRTTPWRTRTLRLYGRQVRLQVKTQVGLWYRVAHTEPIRMIVTHDPKRRWKDRAYFATDAQLSVEAIIGTYAKRWTQEVMFRDVKQHLGLENPQNGWWRRPAGKRRERGCRQRSGPHAHASRGQRAVTRTTPLLFLTYTIVVAWYLRHGTPQSTVAQARRAAPWYRHKRHPSFRDMLTAARAELVTHRLSATLPNDRLRKKLARALPQWIIAA